MAECLLDTSIKVDTLSLSNYKFVKDGGIRFTSFGNASGGKYIGLFRYFLVKDKRDNVQLVSLTVMSCQNGSTLLIVAVDDFDKHHNSLQLSMDLFSEVDNGTMRLFHNGRMAVGNIGQIKSEIVREYVLSKADFKLKDSTHFIIGELDITRELSFENDDVRTLVSNLIEYALLRDELRKQATCGV